MPTEVKGVIELRKAIRKFSPELAKETRKELASLLAPIVKTARGFIPSQAPISGWGKASSNGRFPEWSSAEAKRGIGYKTSPSKPNRSGFRSIARIVNASAAGAIYETAGRKNPNGREQAKMRDVFIPSTGERYKTSTGKNYGKSNNPNAGNIFIEAMDQYSQIKDASNQTGAGRRTSKMKGRAIFRAWAEDGGKTNAAVLKAIENTKIKFYSAMRAK
jgi:hypothetical protein